jgi:hypothetical protein
MLEGGFIMQVMVEGAWPCLRGEWLCKCSAHSAFEMLEGGFTMQLMFQRGEWPFY